MQTRNAEHPQAHPLSLSRYRCYLQRSTQIVESGVMDFLQLRARTAEAAARLALAVSGALAVTDVVRLEDAA